MISRADTDDPRCTLSTSEDATMSAAPPRPSGRRPPGQVRSALIAAGLELARAGGPDAVVLREATRRVGEVTVGGVGHDADPAGGLSQHDGIGPAGPR